MLQQRVGHQFHEDGKRQHVFKTATPMPFKHTVQKLRLHDEGPQRQHRLRQRHASQNLTIKRLHHRFQIHANDHP
jgi:hypothetical protein